ncbi:hypothetical protein GCM10027030_03720 [Luteococcus sediminum]|uniref:hypothetical protein n=1 Tax=Luteococcus sp. TaxID=1969402 RepID=UPI003736ADB5
MTEALPVERFEQLRGEPDDGSWAGTVQLRLLQGQLDPREVDRLMGQVEQAVVDSGEGPETLYGDPSAWAEEALAEASQQGATFVDNDSSPAELVTVALFLAAVGSVMAFLAAAAKALLGRGSWTVDWPVALTVLPAGMAVLAVGAITLRERLVHRLAAGWATAVMAAAMAPVVMGAGWLALRAGSLGSHSAWWWLAQAALWAALAALAARVLPDPGGRRVPTAGMDDVQWVAETRTRLRERGDLTERQVTQALDEARSHAQQSGTALAEEFGSPIGYARSLPGSEVTRRRRETLLWAIATVVYGWLALDTTDGGFWRWVGPALALIAGVLTLRAMLRWQRARRRTRP